MIRYALCCARDHAFESWFSSSADFETQKKRGFVTCPICDSPHVEKAIMAPSLGRVREEPSAAAAESPGKEVVLITEQDRELRAILRALRAKIEAETDNVGPRFAAEARRIHSGEVEARAIRGQATTEEARELFEDGVPFAPVPMLPDEGH